jgi:hypothetical protein
MTKTKLLAVAIALLLLPIALPAVAKPRVQCNNPRPGGQGLTDAQAQSIKSQVGTLGMEQLFQIARPPCIENSTRREKGVPPKTVFLYAGTTHTDRLYRITVVDGVVTNMETRMLTQADYISGGNHR